MSEPLYKNPQIPEEERVSDLLSRMTLSEKLAQLTMSYGIESIEKSIDEGKFPENGVSSTYVNHGVSPEIINRVQKHTIENTRLGIPMSVHGESLHGFMYDGATSFPQAIGLGSTFNPELVAKVADIASTEANIAGVRQTYAPNLDLSREPRWGRVEENYGEDPYLTAKLGVAYIKALQANNVAASPKHYVAHGSPECGINIGPVHAGEREFRETMLEPFRAAVTKGKAMSAMPAYSELDGVPIHASHFLMTEVLRDELGFDGYTVSDFGAISMLTHVHHAAPNSLEAGKMALWAGIDHEAPTPYGFGEDFKEAARSGEIPMEQIDEAVRRTLRIKFRLGLFEDPYAKPEQFNKIHTAESIEAARRIAHESVVLLKNDGILPLSDSIGKVALVGPNSYIAQVGDYAPRSAIETTVTLKDGLEARLGKERVNFAKGSFISSTTPEMLSEAVEAVKASDITVVVLGDNSNSLGGVGWGDDEGGNIATCGEGFDSHDMQLPPAQRELLEAVSTVGKPIILVLENGRPYCIGEQAALSNAVIEAWYPGEQGGNALCDIIFGDVNPSGKLPVTFPRYVGQIPCYYNYKTSARGFYRKPGSYEKPGRDYVFASPEPLYPFGYGLSYTTFEYSDIKADSGKVSIKVTNTGNAGGKETVMMFISQHFCPITPFVKRLRGFEKIYLEKGESKTVAFEFEREDFCYIDEHMKYADGKGTFTIAIGGQTCEIKRT